MRRATLYGTVVAVLTTAVNLLHGVAHEGQHMILLGWQWAYVIVVVFFAPVLAAGLLWARYRRPGTWVLVASMVGSFFGLAYHFSIPGPDNVFALQPRVWRTPFQVSAALLLLLRGIGSLVGAWVLSSMRSPLAGTWRAYGTEPR